MRKIVLLVVCLAPSFAAIGITKDFPLLCLETPVIVDNPTIKIFPNPATDYIELSDTDKVSQIVIYNLTGREMKRFDAFSGEKYYVGDLPKGLYLVQLTDSKNQTIITQRVSKR